MSKQGFEQRAKCFLSHADIEVNDSNSRKPWDIQILNDKFYKRTLKGGSLALGNSYMDGWWTCDAIDQLVDRLIRANMNKEIINPWLILRNGGFNIEGWRSLGYYLEGRLFNQQKGSRSLRVGKQHYDVSNELYEQMLDKRMIYSCGYWKNAKTLEQAQEAKLDLICRKIGLDKAPGQRVLDIGCGWGGFAMYATEKYDANVVGITISKEQMKLARKRAKHLPDVEILFHNYLNSDEPAELQQPFDHIISIGMFEHVGHNNYRRYMEFANQHLKDDGLFLLHTIGGNKSKYTTEPWFATHIFPNSQLPSINQTVKAAEGLFIQEDWHSFGPDYDKTLMAWHKNLTEHWDEIKGYISSDTAEQERSFRMWNYYLLGSAGGFRARGHQLWQFVFSKSGVPGGYEIIR
jgi:cyclopropane-fatty-acyl-phospholipid synthase